MNIHSFHLCADTGFITKQTVNKIKLFFSYEKIKNLMEKDGLSIGFWEVLLNLEDKILILCHV